ILVRGDGHYGRAQVMAWCENNALDYLFGLPGNKVLQRLVDEAADDIRTRPARSNKSWCCAAMPRPDTRRNPGRRTVVSAPAGGNHPRPRHPVRRTNLDKGSAAHVYDVLYCAGGQAENLIKMHKSQLASDCTSCRSRIANQMRLVLHTAAYWLMLTRSAYCSRRLS
ncbi:transposase, partial [Mesorhizobium sp. M0678]|uniref:transposase n=1 Tax=Mesorhizobium sp. M0678 TaxID=2956985 RepID=UPI00333B496F